MCSDVGATSRCCAFYSVVGALFQLFVGMLLVHQPFYISGIEDLQTAKDSAFWSMITFLVTFGISIVIWWRDSRIQSVLQNNNSDYNQVPLHAIEEYELGEATNTFIEDPIHNFSNTYSAGGGGGGGGTLQSRKRNTANQDHPDNNDDELLAEEELESSVPHVPEGQLLPTTHV